ncbi:MAG TPA: isoprenylcysteine carboxylmethyltransferase family protein [Burkholderiales bacterium]|nr:isoprenylcysteine carboxylmethyltransferase family protein [Burkholderiales bacterium]
MSLGGTSFRTFVLYPVLVIAFELWLNDGQLRLQAWGLPLLAWGYLQYRLAGRYRLRLGGGGPGMDTPPERLVTSGPFALCRNPMYLGHLIFLAGLALVLRSWLGAAIALGTAVWLQFRVRRDERRLGERFGEPYLQYCSRVKRWIPALF